MTLSPAKDFASADLSNVANNTFRDLLSIIPDPMHRPSQL